MYGTIFFSEVKEGDLYLCTPRNTNGKRSRGPCRPPYEDQRCLSQFNDILRKKRKTLPPAVKEIYQRTLRPSAAQHGRDNLSLQRPWIKSTSESLSMLMRNPYTQCSWIPNTQPSNSRFTLGRLEQLVMETCVGAIPPDPFLATHQHCKLYG